jgi:hypothetical protein
MAASDRALYKLRLSICWVSSSWQCQHDFLIVTIPFTKPLALDIVTIKSFLTSKGITEGSFLKSGIYTTTDEWIKKMWYLYTMEFYAAMKKNEMLSFTGKWMELENIILSEVSQPGSKNQKSYVLPHM